MIPLQFQRQIMEPSIAWVQSMTDWFIPFNERSNVVLLGIAGQESNWAERSQLPVGYAHSFWQDEKGGAIHALLHHPQCGPIARKLCTYARVSPTDDDVWSIFATEAGDHLALGFARLLLWSDPYPLPQLGDEQTSYSYYVRNWRPGKPSRDRWHHVYPQALEVYNP